MKTPLFLIIFFITIIVKAQTKSECIVGNCDNGYGTYVWGGESEYAGDKYTGYWKNGLRDGDGTYYWASGSKYVGMTRDNKFDGYGILYYSGGDKFEGNWVNSKRNGTGTYTYADGSVKTGTWKDDEYVDARTSGCIIGNCADGYGVYVWPTGEKYEGYWKNDKRNGQGTNYFISGEKYIGEWKDDFRSGHGTNNYKDGTVKTGNWLNDKYEGSQKNTTTSGCISGDCDNGYGVFIFASGEKYDGNWKNKYRTGKGINYFVSGAKYNGDWLNDKKNGQGTYEYANGDVYIGHFVNDNYEGKGIYTYANGDKYTGEFKTGKFHGQGSMIYKDGFKQIGKWEYDKFIGIGSSSTTNNDWDGNGSGFFIDPRGYIATNYHVVEGTTEIEVVLITDNQKKSFKASVISSDKQNDLAIIKIEDQNFKPYIKLPYSFKTSICDVGSNVFALGYPMALTIMGEEVKFTDGKISSKTGFQNDITTYQISVPVQPGNSGGPLFDNDGNIIGIINAKITAADNVSYAIKLNYLINLIDVLPGKLTLPNDQSILEKVLTEKIKILSDYVVLIKVK